MDQVGSFEGTEVIVHLLTRELETSGEARSGVRLVEHVEEPETLRVQQDCGLFRSLENGNRQGQRTFCNRFIKVFKKKYIVG